MNRTVLLACLLGMAVLVVTCANTLHAESTIEYKHGAIVIHPEGVVYERLKRGIVESNERHRGSNPDQIYDQDETFDWIDEDSNGQITVEEWMDRSGPYEDFIDFLIDADQNQDSEISRKEFESTPLFSLPSTE